MSSEEEREIQSMLSGASTCSTSNPSFRTPCGATLQTLTTYAGLKDTKRANYVLLLTDGKENCGGDPSASAAALFALNPSVKTFAVGFGSGVDANELNAVAKSGGTAKSGTPSYYQADDPAGLTAAFTAIAGSVLSCTYSLSGTPPDPNLLYVYFDKVEVKRDSTHANGWDYTKASNQVTFYGAACDKLKSGTVKDLIIVFGCALKIE